MSTTWRNKGYCGRNVNREFIQSQEDLLTGSSKCPTHWLSTKSVQSRRACYYFHRWRCEEMASSSWRWIVITLTIVNYTTRWLLVDNGSSVDILYYLAFQQTRVSKELLRLVNVPLIGFGGMKVLPMDTVSLPVVVSSYPWQINKEVNFLVMDYSSLYNAIIGQPTLKGWRAAMSTYHLSIKFPTKYDIGEVQRG